MATFQGTENDDSLVGGAGPDAVLGLGGNDSLDGGAGADTMIGGNGNDIYVVDDTGDVVEESLNEGTDAVLSSVTYTLSANVENLFLTGGDNIDATGNALVNVLTGNSGDNTLNGMVGADTMVGGEGNDAYVVDDVGDLVIELSNQGVDTIFSSIDFDISAIANFENITLTGNGALTATGNDGDNVLTSNGAAGNSLVGGEGDDTYVVSNVGDDVVEALNEGTDTVLSSVTFTLAANVENLTLTGTDVIDGTGNALDNILTSNGQGSTLTGLDGDDTYYISHTGDVIVEDLNEGTDVVFSEVTHTLSVNVENLTLTSSNSISGTGNALVNTLTGNSGNNTLDGAGGADTMIGGAGDDVYVVDDVGDEVTELSGEGTDTVLSSVTYTLSANVENITLTGGGAVNATGNALNNILTANGAGNTLVGGAGDDTYVVTTTLDTIVENASEGSDTVESDVTFSIAAIANVENITLTGGGAINATGNALNNILTANGAGNTLVGGTGDDTYVVTTLLDTIVENASEGTDTVESSVSYSIAASPNLENITLTGTDVINATGNSGANVITGNGAGGSLIGGAGNDTYVIDTTADIIVENAGEGTDTVVSSVSFSIAATPDLENITLTGTNVINATGNALANVITGNGAGGTLIGGLGNDTYIIIGAADSIVELSGGGTDLVATNVSYTLANNLENLTLLGTGNINATGNAAVNVLTGNSGNNTLDGGLGADTMIGGLGNDTYIVDSSADVVTENPGEGNDTVITSISYALSGNIENLIFTGTGNINGTGDGGNNILTGNSGVNTLVGLGGDDTITGGGGRDVMIGGTGDDTYIVDSTDDVITELNGQGTDLVLSSATYTLSRYVENITLTGGGNINATGNDLDNTITGNTGNNVLNGEDGADTMTGGLGNDTYVVDDIGDSVTELLNEGTDTVMSYISYAAGANIENVTLIGGSKINATGNALNNILTGNSGTNTLIGGLGNDTYYVAPKDIVIEAPGEGTDVVIVDLKSGKYVIPVNVENLMLADGTGRGMLIGDENVNTLTGNAGNNTLDGRGGDDTMIGGLGYDTYYVDSANDLCVEVAGQATDLIYTTVSYDMSTQADAVERLTMLGSDNLYVIGNDWDNILIGNKGNNTLFGGAGNDTMMGGKGNDIYYVNEVGFGGDVVKDTGGYDTIVLPGSFAGGVADITYVLQKGIEALVIESGGDAKYTITGNTSANYLLGGDGDDIIDGGKGADTMDGGDGFNIYIVDNKSDVVLDSYVDDIDDGDIVKVGTTYTMTAGSFVEKVEITGTKKITFTANETGQFMTGNGAKGTTLIAGAGSDTFFFDPAKINNPVTIKNFTANGGNTDVIDISELLTYQDGDIISNWVRVVDKGLDSVISVNTAGTGDAGTFKVIATLYHVNGLTGEVAMFNDGLLVLEST